MKTTYCGADCNRCGYGKNSGCRGCLASAGRPFGKLCFVADMIRLGGKERFDAFQKELIAEFNALAIPGMPEITELNTLPGAYVNLAYPMPNGELVKLLDDREFYLGTQVVCEFDDGTAERFFGLCASPVFLMVAEYGPNGADPELLVYRKR